MEDIFNIKLSGIEKAHTVNVLFFCLLTSIKTLTLNPLLPRLHILCCLLQLPSHALPIFIPASKSLLHVLLDFTLFFLWIPEKGPHMAVGF